MNIWQKVIDHKLVITHLGVAKDDATWDEARKAISELIQWHVDVATNPKVNGGYVLVNTKTLEEEGWDMGDFL